MKNSRLNDVIGVKELRLNLNQFIDAVEKGRSFTVVRRSKPVFKITPLNKEEEWETVIDFRQSKNGSISGEELLKHLRNV